MNRFPFLVCLAALALTMGCSGTVLNLMEGQVESRLSADPVGDLPDGLHVLVCGAGGPIASTNRSSACLAVIAGDKMFLVDVGGGSAATLQLTGFGPQRVSRVLLTHFHSDHIDGLGEVATLRWPAGGWKSPLPVHGPTGVEDVVGGLNAAYKQDQRYRTAHHGEDVTPSAAAGMVAMPFALPADGEAKLVFEEGDLRITSFAVEHEPVVPAVGYRIEYKGRSIAISGDTGKSANLIAQSRGVDVLFHEALSKELVGVMQQAATNIGNQPLAKIMADILDYHASPVEAAESAQAAEVGALVIYHVVPPLVISPLERIFKAGMSDAYDGPIEVSVDGTFVSLPAGTDDIEIDAP